MPDSRQDHYDCHGKKKHDVAMREEEWTQTRNKRPAQHEQGRNSTSTPIRAVPGGCIAGSSCRRGGGVAVPVAGLRSCSRARIFSVRCSSLAAAMAGRLVAESGAGTGQSINIQMSSIRSFLDQTQVGQVKTMPDN